MGNILGYAFTLASLLPKVLKNVEGAVSKVESDTNIKSKLEDALKALSEVVTEIASAL